MHTDISDPTHAQEAQCKEYSPSPGDGECFEVRNGMHLDHYEASVLATKTEKWATGQD